MTTATASLLGQMLMLPVDEPRWSSSFVRQLQELAPGGILLREPLPDSPDSLHDLLRRISQTLGITPLLAIRVEGGREHPLRPILPELPSARALGERGPDAVERCAELLGEALRLLGFNTDFAPLLDLATPFTEKNLGDRTFGSDPHAVAECGAAFIKGLKCQRILACAKHFPGWGSVPPENAHDLPASGKPMAALWREDLVPYRELLPELPMVLVSNAAYKAYDFDPPRPACLSPRVVDGLLRAKLGYRGLALAYDLEAERVRGVLDMGDAAGHAVNAGCDMLLVENGDSGQAMQRAIEEALGSSAISRERLEQSLARIGAVKKGWTPLKGPFPKKAWHKLVGRIEEFNSGT